MKIRPIALFLFCFVTTASAQPRISPKAVKAKPDLIRSQPRISARTDFDRLARVYYQGRFYALPHLMFVIDRAAKAGADNRIYYINSKRYWFHSEFTSANYLTLERGREFFRRNYLEADRRIILGTIAYQTRVDKFTVEFWEGDLATAGIVEQAYKAISESFFAPVYFKPNSAHQEEISAEIPRLLASELSDFLTANRGGESVDSFGGRHHADLR